MVVGITSILQGVLLAIQSIKVKFLVIIKGVAFCVRWERVPVIYDYILPKLH